MEKVCFAYDAKKIIAALKNKYPEIAKIIKCNEDMLMSLSPIDTVDICRIIEKICALYKEPYLTYTQKVTLYKKEIEELQSKLAFSSISIDEYKEIEKITNKIVSCRLDKATLNLNNGVSIIFNSPAKVEDYNVARPSTYADAYSKEDKDNK